MLRRGNTLRTMSDSIFSLTVSEAVARVRAINPRINAFVSTRLDEALVEGEERDAQSRRSPLHGVPYSLKDEWDTVCLPTTGGSYVHRHRRPARNSAVYDVFNDAGAVLLGKTNLSDLGLAPEATNYIVGATRNPFDSTRTAGGSSGGAAAAVATRMVAFDWGQDIGGSIRQPAAFCGVLGLRLASECWPLANSFPKVPSVLTWLCSQGPFTQTIDEMRILLHVTRPRLMTSTPRTFSFRGAVLYPPAHLGEWPTFVQDVTPHLRYAVDGDVHVHQGLPGTDEVIKVYGGLWSANLEELLEADETIGSLGQAIGSALSSLLLRGKLGDKRFHPQCAQLLLMMALGRVTIYRDKPRVMADAQRIKGAFEELWSRGYIAAAPVCVFPAPRIGRTNWNFHLIDCLAPGNIADATGLSIPFGRFGHMPRSIQLLGPPGSEDILLDVADRFIASRDADPSLRPRGWS